MKKPGPKPTFFRRNGLSIVFLALFLITMIAQAVTGWREYCGELEAAHAAAVSFYSYLGTGHFVSATFENFQSEFLQMSLYVVLTIGLRQQGSAESKRLDGAAEVDRIPKASATAPWPVRKGGWILVLYSQSLSICFFLLFFISWTLHFYGSLNDHNLQQTLKHLPTETALQFLRAPTFWFETFQNWQSEFLSVASIVILTIFLRQKGSPESKPVDAPDFETGK